MSHFHGILNERNPVKTMASIDRKKTIEDFSEKGFFVRSYIRPL
jgi:hypothetical protein